MKLWGNIANKDSERATKLNKHLGNIVGFGYSEGGFAFAKGPFHSETIRGRDHTQKPRFAERNPAVYTKDCFGFH